MAETFELQVVVQTPPSRLDVYIAENSDALNKRGISRSQIKNLIGQGRVWVDGQQINKAGFEVKTGMLIRVEIPDSESKLKAYDFTLDLIFEDQHILVINKPAGISMHPGAGHKDQTILNACLPYLSESAESFSSGSRPGIVHRLDKDTTGIVVVARTAQAHTALSKQFAKRSVARAYQVLVATTPRARRLVQRETSGIIDTFIGRDSKDRRLQAVLPKAGRKAVTHWQTIEQFSYACLLEVKLATGRTHQIRVHMQHIGSPVVGDTTYSGLKFLPAALQRASIDFGRQALHAYKLGFIHPVTLKQMEFEVPAPQDMQDLIAMFRNFVG